MELIKRPYNKSMKLFLFIPTLLFFFPALGKECQEWAAQKSKLGLEIKRLKRLKTKNENLFEKYQSNFSAKIKISSNLFIIQTRAESKTLEINSLNKKMKGKNCQAKATSKRGST